MVLGGCCFLRARYPCTHNHTKCGARQGKVLKGRWDGGWVRLFLRTREISRATEGTSRGGVQWEGVASQKTPRVRSIPAASSRRVDNLTAVRTFSLKAKATMWPRLSYMCTGRSKTARGVHLLSRNMQWFQGGLVLKAHRLEHDSTLGVRVIKKKVRGVYFSLSMACVSAIPPSRTRTCRFRV